MQRLIIKLRALGPHGRVSKLVFWYFLNGDRYIDKALCSPIPTLQLFHTLPSLIAVSYAVGCSLSVVHNGVLCQQIPRKCRTIYALFRLVRSVIATLPMQEFLRYRVAKLQRNCKHEARLRENGHMTNGPFCHHVNTNSQYIPLDSLQMIPPNQSLNTQQPSQSEVSK
jgi:hypothetical protein